MIHFPNIPDLAAWLVGRTLTLQDGFPETELISTEQQLDFSLPPTLKDFYREVGNQEILASSFQRFIKPKDWKINQRKIVFLEENQSVCYWATDAQQKVYQTTDLDAPEWHEEPVGLSEFLRVIMYYQAAQGGYQYCGMIPGEEFACLQDAQELIDEMGGEAVADIAGLKIFVVSDQVLVWYLHENEKLNPGLFLSALREEKFHELCEKWLFDDLN